jgi:hypothetical protein
VTKRVGRAVRPARSAQAGESGYRGLACRGIVARTPRPDSQNTSLAERFTVGGAGGRLPALPLFLSSQGATMSEGIATAARTCRHCGAPMPAACSRGRMFCTDHCRQRAEREPAMRFCGVCSGRLARGARLYCCPECAQVAAARRQRCRPAQDQKPKRRVCIACGAKFRAYAGEWLCRRCYL